MTFSVKHTASKVTRSYLLLNIDSKNTKSILKVERKYSYYMSVYVIVYKLI
jgi:hypothetical protein